MLSGTAKWIEQQFFPLGEFPSKVRSSLKISNAQDGTAWDALCIRWGLSILKTALPGTLCNQDDPAWDFKKLNVLEKSFSFYIFV
jgi:hypothetical protein